MSSGAKCFYRGTEEFFFNQDVIRIEGRNRDDWNSAICQWVDKRRQHAYLGEWKWASKLEADPGSFRFDARRNIFCQAHN